MEGFLKIIGVIIAIIFGLFLIVEVVFPLLEMLAKLVSNLMIITIALGAIWFVFILIRNLFRSEQ